MTGPASQQNAGPLVHPDEWSALMARAQDGDAHAYRRLLTAITPYLRAISGRAHRNPSDAEDSVQDILLTVHAVRHTYDPTRPFKPWLAGIAQHRVGDRLRRRARMSAREVSLALEHEAFAAPDNQEADRAFDQRGLHIALQTLPKGQLLAVTMTKLREMSLHDAAAETGVSVGALKVATHRGMQALRRLLVREKDER